MPLKFFFYYSAGHHDLHSFPTRRSSDLHPGCRSKPGQRHAVRRVRGGLGRTATRDRSEEHTSELQSRFDLVCRLLLEKKKLLYPRTRVFENDLAAVETFRKFGKKLLDEH